MSTISAVEISFGAARPRVYVYRRHYRPVAKYHATPASLKRLQTILAQQAAFQAYWIPAKGEE